MKVYYIKNLMVSEEDSLRMCIVFPEVQTYNTELEALEAVIAETEEKIKLYQWHIKMMRHRTNALYEENQNNLG